MAPAALYDEVKIVERIARVGAALASELDLEKIVQAATDAATEVSGAEFGAFFYNVVNAAGESYMLYTISGVPREAFSKFPMPRNTQVFAPTFSGEGTVRSDDITQDPRYGHNAPRKGMPEGHLPVRSYLAASVISRTGEVIGGLFFGHSRPGVFTAESEKLVELIASQASVAIDNARLFVRETLAREEAQATANALRKLQERFDIVVESTDLGVWYCDLPFDKLSWNAKVKEHFWLPPDADVTIELFYARLHPEDRERTRDAIAQSIRDKTSYDIDYRTVSDRGEIKWIRANGRAIYNEAGDAIRFDGITIDLTQRKQQEEVLIKSEKLAATGRMAATIAHEINNPLEAVTNLLFLARRHGSLTPEVGQWLETADHELARVSHITKQTLGFYRESNQPQTFNIAQAIEQTLVIFNAKIERMGLALTVDADRSLEQYGYAGEIRQVIANLVANALDATPQGGRLIIRARPGRGMGSDPGVRITLADTGSGITETDRHRIFEPFFTTKRDVGTGLGLWVSKEIVRKHGGSIRVRSRTNSPRSGTVFTIFLPSTHRATAKA